MKQRWDPDFFRLSPKTITEIAVRSGFESVSNRFRDRKLRIVPRRRTLVLLFRIGVSETPDPVVRVTAMAIDGVSWK